MPVVRMDAEGNSYELRVLDDGSRHEVLKNFPSAGEVHSVLASAAIAQVEIVELSYFWCARYTLPTRTRPD